ncbi:MAG: CoA-binding protein [Blastocatellia bacterium]
MTNWQEKLIDSSAPIRDLLSSIKRIAVLGIKTERQANQPAFYVPQYLASAGYEVIPVPVYYPEVTEILGQKVYRRVSDIPAAIDLVNVFRRGEDIDQHVEDILAKAPRAVWFQLGIRNDRAAERLAKAGIQVVQDRCIMVDHRMIS